MTWDGPDSSAQWGGTSGPNWDDGAKVDNDTFEENGNNKWKDDNNAGDFDHGTNGDNGGGDRSDGCFNCGEVG